MYCLNGLTQSYNDYRPSSVVIKFQNEKSITHSDQTAKPVDRFVSSKATEITKHKQLLLKVVRVKKNLPGKRALLVTIDLAFATVIECANGSNFKCELIHAVITPILLKPTHKATKSAPFSKNKATTSPESCCSDCNIN